MVILGGLELVAGAYIINKHSKNKKERQRLEEEAFYLQQQQRGVQIQPTVSNQRKHSHDRKHSPSKKHSHDHKHSHDGRKPSKESRPQQPQYNYIDTSQPPRASSAPPQGAVYPPGVVYHQNQWPQQPQNWEQQQAPNHQWTNFPPNYNDTNTYTYQNHNQYPPTPHLNASRSADTYPNEKSLPRQSEPSRGRSETQYNGGVSELSSSARPYNTHLSPSPHVRFAVPNDRPQPGDRTPPPAYMA